MGVVVSKAQQNHEKNMEGPPKTVPQGDKETKSNHSSENTPTKVSGLKHAEGMARVTEEEPRLPKQYINGGHNASRFVRVTNFDGSISKLENYFNKNYPSVFKQVNEGDWGELTVEFKSRQVAVEVVQRSHKVGKLDLSLESIPKAKEKKSTKGLYKGQGPETKANGHLYPVDELQAVQYASQEDHTVSKLGPGLSEVKRHSQYQGWQETDFSQTPKSAMLPGMQNYDNDEEDRRSDDIRVTDESTKATKKDTEGQEKNTLVDETDIDLDAVKVEFIQKVHRQEYEDICRVNKVSISQETESQTCKVIFRANATGKGNVHGACDQFVDLYHRISTTLSRNNTVNVLKVLPNCTIRSLHDALARAKADERVLVKNCLSDDFKVVFYGSERDVANAIETFIENSGKQDHAQGREEDTRRHIKEAQQYKGYAFDRIHVQPSSDTRFEGKMGDITVRVYEGDLTKEMVDVVVNAANKRLEHAGGVALAISRAGGRTVEEESRQYIKRHGNLAVGQAMHTRAGNMSCKYVIHTVGPKWGSHESKETVKAQLYEAVINVLHHASNTLQATSIAIPAISAGIYGVPVEVCAEQLMLATLKFTQSPPHNNTLRHINFVNIDTQINHAFVRTFSANLPSNPNTTHLSGAVDDKDCPICMDKVVQPTRLYCCGNVFCDDCINQAFQVKPVCPTCAHQHGALKGTQPKGGTMKVARTPSCLPGYQTCGTIEISYNIPNGIQEDCHPSPGKPYQGSRRLAFLPDNTEGQHVLRLLTMAFNNRLVFTIGTSVTTGETDVVIWNDIHHKTSPHGGPSNYGYPDPGYLRRVTEELAAKGIK